MGWRLSPSDGGGFEVNLDAVRRDGAEDTSEYRVGFGVTARWSALGAGAAPEDGIVPWLGVHDGSTVRGAKT